MSRRHKAQRAAQSRTAKASNMPDEAQRVLDANWDDECNAYVQMIGRSGAEEFMMRFQDEETPVVFVAQASYNVEGQTAYKFGCGLLPKQALFDLLENVMDGGTCTHCSKPTGVTSDFQDMPLPDYVCWYQWDPETKTIRRGCAGG